MNLEKPGMEWQIYSWGYHDGRMGETSRASSFADRYYTVYEYGYTRGKEDKEMLETK